MKKLFFILLSSLSLVAYAQDPEDPIDRIDGSYEPVTLKEREIVAYDHLRQSDVKWEKTVWRVIDFKEKLNLPFAHPKKGLVSILHKAATEGEIEVFAISDAGETFKDKMKVEDVKTIGAINDSVDIIDVNDGSTKKVARVEPFDPAKVTKLRIKEKWYFDIETSTLIVRIIGMSMITEKYSETGDLIGDQPMYWIYYPDVRKLMAQNQVYNTKNDANTTSWEDIMEMRYFSSYIMKESHGNPFDRKISEYATGLDLLYESDRIHNEIRNYESDLWEY